MSAPAENVGAALRASAARLNSEVVNGGRSLAGISLADEGFEGRDLSLLGAMLAESLRWHHRFEWQLASLLDRPIRRRDRQIAALLRIGLTQLAILRIPEHAAVSATVAAASALGFAHARGLVNAVLRRYLREREALDEACLGDDVARFSHPAWLIEAIRRDWPERYASILDANNAPPPLWLRVNRRRIGRKAYLERLADAGIEATVHEPYRDAVLVTEPRPAHDLPGFAEGLVSVQDAGAQRAADVMQLAPGQRVLDACAAPGGKTAHLLERCAGLGELIALDADATRLARARKNLDRLGLAARLIEGSALEPGDWHAGPAFDRVLLDAPCSATGVIRRHPDIKVLRRADDLGPLAATQGRMLDALWPLLATGGLMVYVTCSVLTAENFAIVNAFARRTPDANLASFGSAGHFQLLPGETDADGFYYACLSRGRGSHKYNVSAGES